MIGAIVLAAGASSRLGRPKASLPVPHTGRTFAETVLATLRAAEVGVVRVVVAPGAAGPNPEEVVNPDPGRGMLSSVQTGLRALPPEVEAVLVWPVDHPFVTVGTVRSLVDRFRSGAPPVVVPSYRGRRGHPALFAARVIPELMTADPAEGARSVVLAHADRVELPVEDPGVIGDIDTPDDYRRWTSP
ncbi:MAG TPA: nucleotidyltransferase family protein [Candidatus Polarisedimenticolaceae bacterium]|nr:nucleotidyltransferase family protein [Candidatus Polarisedimenticolaceae bacterium]